MQAVDWSMLCPKHIVRHIVVKSNMTTWGLGFVLHKLQQPVVFSCSVLSSAVCCVPEALLQAVVLC